MEVHAGDRLYIPAGALKIEISEGGSVISSIHAAVDPWLPDRKASLGMSPDQVYFIEAVGFPLRTICADESIIACRPSDKILQVLYTTGMERQRYIAVVENNSVIGTIDLDHARGVVGNDSDMFVRDHYKPNTESSVMSGNAPLMDYILSSDKQPYRIVDLGDERCGNVDVFCLQKLPVRSLLQLQFSHLELKIADFLCLVDSSFSNIVGNIEAKEFASFGQFAGGPEKRIDKLRFNRLLREAKRYCPSLGLSEGEVEALTKFRNHIFHGPRWYITRRGDVNCLVNCVKRIRELIQRL